MPAPPYTLRAAHPGDEAALSLVASASFLEAFAGTLDGPDILAHCANNNSIAKYTTWLATPGYRIALAEATPGAAPIGYALLSPPDLPIPLDPATDIELKRIYLLHRFQGSGIGAALLAWAATEARSMRMHRLLLGVYGGNDQAIAFYEHSGFTRIGTRQFLVGSTLHDDLVMGLDL